MGEQAEEQRLAAILERTVVRTLEPRVIPTPRAAKTTVRLVRASAPTMPILTIRKTVLTLPIALRPLSAITHLPLVASADPLEAALAEVVQVAALAEDMSAEDMSAVEAAATLAVVDAD